MSSAVKCFSLVVALFYAVILISFSGIPGVVCRAASRVHGFASRWPSHHHPHITSGSINGE